MKRLILALVVGGALFGTVWGVAAALGVNSGALQSGQDNVQCDTNGVDVYYQDTGGGPAYDQATVSGIDCPGTYDITVEVQDLAANTLAIGTNNTSGVSAIVAFGGNGLTLAEVASADHVIVTIVGTGP